ncbi:hypothetical protein F8M41_016069 [Gigaspora margarita]|uniref:Uncharacterized protein n=1 Tax=Gigaspora margarita TaxID=4874 RepID=A0A8H3WX95_GIGMA|nr:hypothetical protein F8M41_016069 [Gigaspora margarita]
MTLGQKVISTNKQSATETSKRAQKRLRRDVIKESSSVNIFYYYLFKNKRSIAETSEPAQKRPRKDVA